ncbi:chromate efflux transporter [Actibacterium lipolyticum]|uniref:Putative chromate transport protein n=1 Tax=Actibacterium lipolyticum TaxID=1524263 RepID=A0A238JXT9_9RHOB|nr:chromate efflux transporter [Actibacterium lipolyticum]SMX34662.1 putative chromate transport protein [Actibacterium lipolyticum]
METPSFRTMLSVFGRIGLLSFGGPAAQIALMHRELVDDRQWLSEAQFLRALSFCMLLPGPEAMQLATYSGWRMRGVPGGLLAGLLFVLPGAAVVLGLAVAYGAYGNVPLAQSLFLGVKATVVIIVIEALIKLSKRALHSPARWVIAALSFLGIFAFGLPFPLIIALAALYGFVTADRTAQADVAPPPQTNTARTVALWAVIWLLPVALLYAVQPGLLGDIALFFSKLAIVTFGGAYAVLAYMTQAVVGEFNWLTTPEMMDGLGLAETTPGPLILVTEFVGYLAAYKAGGVGAGILGAIVTLWVTFAPCFLWIFAGAPYIDRLATQPRLSAALSCVTAAVVGVILNLTLWFSAHVFFGQVQTLRSGPIDTIVPIVGSLNLTAITLAVLAGVLLLWRRWNLPLVLVLMATLGAITAVL